MDARGATITDIYVKYFDLDTQVFTSSIQILKYLNILTLNAQIFMSNENLLHD